MKLTALSFDLNETRSTGNDGSVFQIIPRFAIEPENDDEVKQEDYLSFSMGGNTDIGLAIGSELLIVEMKNETVTQRKSFSATIDFVQWSKSLLVVGLRNSMLVFLNPTSLEQLDERLLDPSYEWEKSPGKYFCGGHINLDPQNSVCEVLAMTTKGIVSLFRTAMAPDNTLDYTRLEQSTFIHDTDVTEVTASVDAYRSIICSTFVGSKFIISVEDHGLISISELVLQDQKLEATFTPQITAVNPEPVEDEEEATGRYRTLHFANLLGDIGLSYRDAKIVKIERCEGLLFALLSSGQLEILLDEELWPAGRLNLHADNSVIYDFTVVLRDQDLDVWAAFGCVNSDGSEEMYVGVYGGPTFEPKFVIKVPQSYFILSSEEDKALLRDGLKIRFDIKATIHDEPTALIQTSAAAGVRVYQFLESSTDATLQRLVSQGKFDQANELALKYSIHTDIVNKARVTSYYNSFPTQNSDKILQRTFSAILTTLDSISDLDFICKFCTCDTNTLVPKIEWVKQLLQFGFKRAGPIAGTEHGKSLLQLMKKFYTFECVMPGASVQDWKGFCNQDTSMLHWCKRFLQNGQLVNCNTVWTRHSDEFLTHVTQQEVGEFIWSLYTLRLSSPESVTLFTSILNDVMRFESELHADRARVDLLLLVKKQVLFMEQEQDWPAPALKFVEILIRVFGTEEKKFDTMIRTERLAEKSWYSKRQFCEQVKLCLDFMLKSLLDLKELIRAHSMRVPFNKFVQDNLYEVVNAMLDELFVREEIHDFVKGFLESFARSKNLNTDKLYASHIESVMEKLIYFSNSSSIPYEERLICLIELTQELSIKLSSVLEMAKNWPVPWSEGMENLVNKILRIRIDGYIESDGYAEVCRDLLRQIQAVKLQVPYQCLLHKYRLTASKLDLDFNVWMALKRIISMNKPGYLENCFELIKYAGSYSPTDVRVLNYCMELRSQGLDHTLESVISDNPAEADLKSFANKCLDVVIRPRQRMPPEVCEAHLKLAEILNNKLDSPSDNDLLLLRRLIPDLSSTAILSHEMYPFVLLEFVLPQLVNMNFTEALQWCSKLSNITFTGTSDIILALLFSIERFAEKMKDKAWNFIRYVVNTPIPIRSETIADVVMGGLAELLCENPNLSYENQTLLQAFLEFLLKSFSKYSRELSGLWSWQHLFISMREQEIPLETKLVYIIKGVTGVEAMRVEDLYHELQEIGQQLTRYGEIEMIKAIVNTVILNYHGLRENPEATETCDEIINHLMQLLKNLINQFNATIDPEDDPHVINLVQGLHDASIIVNGFALRQRNKTKLIDQLLKQENYLLASEVAIVFHHRDERQWSNVLDGFLKKESIEHLVSLLRRLSSVTEVWILPEFAQAWQKVSLHSPELSHLCPIPLEERN